MANDVMDMSAFQGKRPSQAFGFLNPQQEKLSDGIGSSYGVIGYKGKVWSLRFRGEHKTFVRPDDGTPASYLDVIIVGQAKQKSKSYYSGYNDDAAGERPLCSSIDGSVPDPDVRQKQSDTCALCPRNVWKTNEKGRKSRECSDYKRLAVLVMPTQTQKVWGEALMEPMFLRVPPASLNSLAKMGDEMGDNGWHFSTYVTRITFDPEKPHPQMVFRAIQGLSDQEAPVIQKLIADPLVGRITSGDVVLPGSNAVRLVPAPTTQAPTTQAPTTQAPPPPTNLLGAPVTPVRVGFDEPQSGTVLELKANPAPPPADAPAAVQAQTVEDTGEPEEADADLDARLNAMLPK